MRSNESASQQTFLSVVMPVYNEASVIEGVVGEFRHEVLDKLRGSEMIIVDDRSTDETPDILDRISHHDDRLRILRNDVNRGHGPTLRRAIEAASGEWVFHVDSDGQFVAGDFWTLWERRRDADLVLGYRAQRNDPRHRILLTFVVRLAVSMLARAWIRDANVPFRLFRRTLWLDLRPLITPDALAPSIMVSLGSTSRGWRLKQVPVRHLARPHGVSTLRLWRLARFCVRGLLQLVRFRTEVARMPIRTTHAVDVRKDLYAGSDVPGSGDHPANPGEGQDGPSMSMGERSRGRGQS